MSIIFYFLKHIILISLKGLLENWPPKKILTRLNPRFRRTVACAQIVTCRVLTIIQ